MVAYNVQSAVDTTNHLIVAHEVTNVGTDRSQLATMAQAAKAALRSDHLDVVADRGYFKGEELLACEQAGVAVTLPKPQTSGAKSAGRFGKPDFVYLAKDDVYRCPSGEKASANTAPMMTSRASGTQLRPPLCELRIPRSVPTNRWDESRGSTAMTSAALRNRPTSAFNQAAPRSRERNTPP